MSDWIWALIIGFVLDLLLGDPAWLYHPVCLIGKYIGWMEKKLRRRGGQSAEKRRVPDRLHRTADDGGRRADFDALRAAGGAFPC